MVESTWLRRPDTRAGHYRVFGATVCFGEDSRAYDGHLKCGDSNDISLRIKMRENEVARFCAETGMNREITCTRSLGRNFSVIDAKDGDIYFEVRSILGLERSSSDFGEEDLLRFVDSMLTEMNIEVRPYDNSI